MLATSARHWCRWLCCVPIGNRHSHLHDCMADVASVHRPPREGRTPAATQYASMASGLPCRWAVDCAACPASCSAGHVAQSPALLHVGRVQRACPSRGGERSALPLQRQQGDACWPRLPCRHGMSAVRPEPCCAGRAAQTSPCLPGGRGQHAAPTHAAPVQPHLRQAYSTPPAATAPRTHAGLPPQRRHLQLPDRRLRPG